MPRAAPSSQESACLQAELTPPAATRALTLRTWRAPGLSCSGAPRSHAGQLRTDGRQQHPQGLSEGTGEAQPDTMKTL